MKFKTFFFEALLKYDEVMRGIGQKPKVRVVVLEKIFDIDPTGLRCLKDFAQRCKKQKIRLILSGVNTLVFQTMQDANLYDFIKKENVFSESDSEITGSDLEM
ncbi:MAG: sodium-independent anion transporter [Candidatus Omnitrophota bacterium]|jgi:SulP family sulfate permease